MNKNKEKKEIKTLDTEIKIVQIEKFANDFNNAMEKDIKSRLKKVILVISPLILSLIGLIIFKNPILLVIGTSITGISGIIAISKDFIKDMNSLNLKNNQSNYDNIKNEQGEDVEKILEEGIGKVKGEDLYSEKYKSAIKKEENYAESKEEKKYREAVERQQKKINKNYYNLKIAGNDTDYLDKEQTMEQIIRETDAYTVAYNLPPLKISNNQWDLFFDITYNFFEKKEIEKEFYNLISQVGRFVFAKSLLSKKMK